MKNWKNKKSTGFDNIDMTIVKHVISHIVKPLSYICNMSLTSGIFPNNMKIAKVIPLYKANGKNEFTNYRPVSLLPQLSKILEKLFGIRLDSFINRYNLLSSNQYGFRTNMSTSLALMELTEEITTALDDKKVTAGVFIDLKKAFDTINHNLLLKKLAHYGVRGVANKWLASYLSNRKQYVSIDECNSDLLNVLCGVPQGSILGPKLFILYVNDMCNISKILKFVLFADDTNIFCSGHDAMQLSRDLSNELDKLSVWFAVNKLILNVSKTNFMVFGNSKQRNTILQVSIKNSKIKRVYVTKFLGILIDDRLNWKEHISLICSKLSKCIAIIYKPKHLSDKDSLVMLYDSLFVPYLSYCSEIWGNTYKTNINCVYVLQKKVLRIVCNVDYQYHSNVLFKELRMLKLFDIIELKTAMIMYKANKKMLPLNIQRLFSVDEVTYYNTRQLKNMKQVYIRTTLKSKCISICGVKLWNSLKMDLRNSTSLPRFKKEYKKSLLQNYDLSN